jgi:hypothetical protein
LDIILQAETLEEVKKLAENHLGVSLRVFQEELSVFEQYTIRPAERKFVPNIWKYRIIAKNQKYYFGTI